MKRLATPIALLLLFSLGLGIRLYDLTDPPFDFHPTRQWRAAIIARGMFYEAWEDAPQPERSIAIAQREREALIEPPIMEWISSRIYLAAGEPVLWAPRVASALFWLTGGLAVFLLTKEITSTAGALISLTYFLFLPYAMIASRSFQPDPLMVALLAWAYLYLFRWSNQPSWKHTLAAGLFAGLAILTKLVAAFFIGFGALFVILFDRGWRKSLMDAQTWVIALLSLLPVGLYYINGLYITGFLAGQTSHRFFPAYWTDPAWYIRWVEMAGDIAGFSVLLIGLAGLFLIRDRSARFLLAGTWIGYILYSFTFPFHTITHDYYQLPLILTAALCLAPPASVLFRNLEETPYRTIAFATITAMIAGAVLFKVWDTRVILARRDYRSEAAEWSRFQEILPANPSVVAMTQAYGFPLAYYGWITADAWPTSADITLRTLSGEAEEDYLARRYDLLEEHDFFLITNFNEFDSQTELQEYLYNHYNVYAEGDGYLIFDLR